MEAAEADCGRDQVLRGERPADTRTEGVTGFRPRRPRLPALRQVERHRQVPQPLSGVRQEEQVTPDRETELFPEVPVAAAGEPHVAVPLARPGPHGVAHHERRGERSAQHDAGDVQGAVVERGVLDRRGGRDRGSIRAGGRDVLDLEHAGRREPAQFEPLRRRPLDPHRHRQAVRLPFRPRRGDCDRDGGRTLAAGQKRQRRNEEEDRESVSRRQGFSCETARTGQRPGVAEAVVIDRSPAVCQPGGRGRPRFVRVPVVVYTPAPSVGPWWSHGCPRSSKED